MEKKPKWGKGQDAALPERWEEKPVLRSDVELPVKKLSWASTYDEATQMSSVEDKKEEKGMLGRLLVLMAVFVILALAILLGGWAYRVWWEREAVTIPQESESDGDQTPSRVIFVREDGEEAGRLTAPEIYASCADTVVSILTESDGRSGVGSGFFLRSDGYIGTAYHVLESSERQTVVLSDGRQYDATLVAGNELSDLALLKIDGEGFRSVTVGSSEKLLVGERVYAIGTTASLDYAGSITSGEVSYLGRTVRISEENTGTLQKKMRLIQTTTPVNRGNSGCPLFDGYGNLVGVVTMRLGDSFTGMGFAIPADGAIPILEAMMAGEEPDDTLLSSVAVRAPKLGVLGEADSEGGVFGVRITGFSDSAHTVTGLKVGDLILRIGTEAVCTVSDVARVLRDKNPADRVLITVLRGAQSLTFEVILAD